EMGGSRLWAETLRIGDGWAIVKRRQTLSRRIGAGIAFGLVLGWLAATSMAQDSSAGAGLKDPAKKEIAMELVSSAENSSLDWKAQYGYIEYNVEKNERENRGYTGGIIGFTSKTHDMLELVEYYDKIAPGNVLEKYLAPLKQADGTSSKKGLGK